MEGKMGKFNILTSGHEDACFPKHKCQRVSAVGSVPEGSRSRLLLEAGVNSYSTVKECPWWRILRGSRVKRDFPSSHLDNQKNSITEVVKPIRVCNESGRGSHVKRHFPSSRLDNQRKSIIEVVKPIRVCNGSGICESDKVKSTLRLFRGRVAELMQGQGQGHVAKSGTEKILVKVAMLLRKEQRWIDTCKKIGKIPGVKVGDEFQWRAELNIIGLHQQFSKGIDYLKTESGKLLATSIVDSGRYSVERTHGDGVLIYTGEGGNPKVSTSAVPEDQKLKGGNLALKNSMSAKSPVRVILRVKTCTFPSRRCVKKRKNDFVYVYDGLYFVEHFWQDRGPFGLVFKFSLMRSSEQNGDALDEMSRKTIQR